MIGEPKPDMGSPKTPEKKGESNEEYVKKLITTALHEAEKENWHEVWRLFKSDIKYWLGHEFAVNDIKLGDEDVSMLDEIESMLPDINDYKSVEEFDKKSYIHPTFVKKEVEWAKKRIEELKELSKEDE